MNTKENILKNATFREEKVQDPQYKPIFIIMLTEFADKECIYEQTLSDHTVKRTQSGFPETGDTWEPAFYHNIDDAINAIKTNACDMQEGTYEAAWLLCRFPGLYDCVSKEYRMFFRWHSDTNAFIQEEEPEIFAHTAF